MHVSIIIKKYNYWVSKKSFLMKVSYSYAPSYVPVLVDLGVSIEQFKKMFTHTIFFWKWILFLANPTICRQFCSMFERRFGEKKYFIYQLCTFWKHIMQHYLPPTLLASAVVFVWEESSLHVFKTQQVPAFFFSNFYSRS